MNGQEYDPSAPFADADDGERKPVIGGRAGEPMQQNEQGGSGYYVDEDGEEDEDDGFAVTLNTQTLSTMASAPVTTGNARAPRSTPQSMRSFNASGPAGASGPGGAAGASAGPSAKVTASLAPLTTLGSGTKQSLAPNPNIGGLLNQSDEARYYAHLEASAMENYPDKPWTRDGVDPSDFFNYGFTEATWALYRERQLSLRREHGSFETFGPNGGSSTSGSGQHQRGGRQQGRLVHGGQGGGNMERGERGGQGGGIDRGERGSGGGGGGSRYNSEGSDSRRGGSGPSERGGPRNDRRGGDRGGGYGGGASEDGGDRSEERRFSDSRGGGGGGGRDPAFDDARGGSGRGAGRGGDGGGGGGGDRRGGGGGGRNNSNSDYASSSGSRYDDPSRKRVRSPDVRDDDGSGNRKKPRR